MDKTVAIGMLALGAVILLSVHDDWIHDRLVDWRLGRLPRVRISQVGDRAVRIVGRARATGPTLVAPLSDRRCLAFRLRVHEQPGRARSTIGAVLDLRGSVPFVVTDDSGEVWVSDGSRDISLSPALTGTIGGYLRERAAEVDERRLFSLLEGHGVNTEKLWGGEKKFRFEESILDVDGRVAVGGVATRELDLRAERPTSRVLPERWVFRSTTDHPLLISNASGLVRNG